MVKQMNVWLTDGRIRGQPVGEHLRNEIDPPKLLDRPFPGDDAFPLPTYTESGSP